MANRFGHVVTFLQYGTVAIMWIFSAAITLWVVQLASVAYSLGDAFTASLAVGVARGLSLPEAARIANAAGALACTGFGAQPSMPTGVEIKMLMDDQSP